MFSPLTQVRVGNGGGENQAILKGSQLVHPLRLGLLFLKDTWKTVCTIAAESDMHVITQLDPIWGGELLRVM